MPKLNVGRSSTAEANLARRIARVRQERGQSYETLAELMTSAGCAIAGSSIYKIEKGTPPRRVSVDELVALSEIWGLTIEDLLQPVDLLDQKRAQEIALELPKHLRAFQEALAEGVRAYEEYGRIAAGSEELLEYMNNFAGALWAQDDHKHSALMAIDPSDPDLQELQQRATKLWGSALQYADRRAQRHREES